jgi:hypothetical protein
MINYDCQSLEPILLSHDICTIFTNFVLLSYNMCDKSMFFECQKKETKFAAYVIKLFTLHLFYHQMINALHMNVPIEIVAWCTKKKKKNWNLCFYYI